MNYQAAIFDMDGLLLDTERVCMQIFKQACIAQQLPFYENVYFSMIGRNAAGIENILKEVYGDDLDRLRNDWRERYDVVVKHKAIPVKEGVVELLEWLKKNNIPTAVATSTAREVAQIKLKLAGLDKYFDNITTGCEVNDGKPDPEIFLLAAKRLNIEPAFCLAFEDSNNGIRAAVGANMIAFQIPDLVEPSEEIRQLGQSILPSLCDVLSQLKHSQIKRRSLQPE
ncbi:HAD family hydrolase [Vibrio sagamiensis]|uniref:Phosphatase n=1 Tax=Vibrio sagamiensis NBRC 104589 TaxID=1219064 RepID=A0A511QGZ1_9VIBR|nr:HAD family phosphatase [Vibrio sagamiensis]PNQ56758.1 HAD family phosphatase [Vibrio agarivorans]GEM76585.1 phosphatase [Vibrio sagamiensis NBRC 104589]